LAFIRASKKQAHEKARETNSSNANNLHTPVELISYELYSREVADIFIRDYADFGILLSDSFLLNFDHSGTLESVQIIPAIESFKQGNPPSGVAEGERLYLIVNRGVNPRECIGINDVNLGGIFRDDGSRQIWTGARHGDWKIVLPGVAIILRNDQIVAVRVDYSHLD